MGYFGNGGNLYSFALSIILNFNLMQNTSKIYNFYVLVSENDPENVRYVGVTTKKVKERFNQHKYCAVHKDKRGLPVHKWMFSKYQKGENILVK
jgi:hypothetical protein